MNGYVSSEGSLEAELERSRRAAELENEPAKERRLELEAQNRYLGELREAPTARGDRVRVEVTVDELGLERCGYFLVTLVDIPAELYEGMSDEQKLENHPAVKARELALAELERRHPESSYRSVDDTYAA